MAPALAYVRVLVRAGPTCVRQPADWDAGVGKIEQADGGMVVASLLRRIGTSLVEQPALSAVIMYWLL